MEAPQIPFLADLSEEELDGLDQMQPIEFAYPKDNGPIQQGIPSTDLTDQLRTAVGNQLGPVPKAELDAMSPSQLRALKNQRFEEAAGWAKPLAQFYNVITSPAAVEGMVIGIPNAVSKLANASMDAAAERLTGKPWDNEPAWQIPQDPLKRLNPYREGDMGDTPADRPGFEFGAEATGEVAGVFTGQTLIKNLKRVPQLVNLANKVKQQQQVRRLAVAAQGNNTLRRGINRARFGGEAFVDTTIASLFQDAEFGNVSDLFGPNPLSTSEDNSYFENLRNKQIADGILTPLALIGAGQLTPWTRRLADGDLAFGLDELAKVELEPYVPRRITQPLLPPGAVDEGFDSAIDRSTSANLQVQQVQSQRARLNTMFPGLKTFEGGEGQFSLDITGAGGAFREDGAPLPRVENPDGEGTIVSGPEMEFRQSPKQMKLDLTSFEDAPDPRPELSTFLAELDELDDFQLKEMLPKVSQEDKLQARQVELEATEAQLAAQRERIAEINERGQLPEGTKRRMTPDGVKRETKKVERKMEELQATLLRLQAPEVESILVGDQLQLAMQQSLDLTAPDIELPAMKQFVWDEAKERWVQPEMVDVETYRGGHESPEAYREAISGWNRDLLRKMASPTESPEIAAVLKARTGRRVWNAKKEDIVNAMVEVAARSNTYVETVPAPPRPAPEQLPLEGLQQSLDVTPDPEFPGGRGMDAETRESIKQRILQAAIDNGEVQIDVTPIPDKLPATEFDQGRLLDELFDDQLELIKFANDETPTYKAGGKSAESLLEEVRQRFDWAEMDGAAQQANRQAMFQKNGWNELTWEEKKRAGLLTREETGFYVGEAGEVTDVTSDQLLEWTPDGVIPAKDAAIAKPKDKPKKKRSKTKTSSQVTSARKNTDNVRKQLDAINRQLEKGTCNG